ncbi:molybdenum ABC transporter substrate-binding protein [Allostella vacuolata]|nr:molybdenum ABC transporter substrate-binding protein [Stella vacuolata]
MRSSTNVSLLAKLVVLGIAVGAAPGQAAEIKLMAANAVKGAIGGLLMEFEGASGHRVAVIWGGTEGIAKRVGGGEAVDIVLIGSANIDRLIAGGRLLAGSRTDIAKSGVGMAVRSGLPKPDISTGEAVRKAVLEARSVAYSSGPSGFYIADLFRTMGIAQQVEGKVRQPPSGAQVGELVARGEADLGFQQVSELLHVKGIEYLGPLPAEIQNITVYSAALHRAAADPDAARALVQFLTRPESGAAVRKAGMEPG